MRTVSISELKANLSRYLREIRRGGEVQVLDRGVPVARLTALTAGARGDERERLIRSGVLRAGQGRLESLLDEPPLEVDADLGRALAEDRGDRL